MIKCSAARVYLQGVLPIMDIRLLKSMLDCIRQGFNLMIGGQFPTFACPHSLIATVVNPGVTLDDILCTVALVNLIQIRVFDFETHLLERYVDYEKRRHFGNNTLSSARIGATYSRSNHKFLVSPHSRQATFIYRQNERLNFLVEL